MLYVIKIMRIVISRQGLVFDPKTGNVIESCGRYGSSYITIYSTDKKKVYLRKSLPKYVFGTIGENRTIV